MPLSVPRFRRVEVRDLSEAEMAMIMAAHVPTEFAYEVEDIQEESPDRDDNGVGQAAPCALRYPTCPSARHRARGRSISVIAVIPAHRPINGIQCL